MTDSGSQRYAKDARNKWDPTHEKPEDRFCIACGLSGHRPYVWLGTFKIGHYAAQQNILLCGECVDVCTELIAEIRQSAA